MNCQFGSRWLIVVCLALTWLVSGRPAFGQDSIAQEEVDVATVVAEGAVMKKLGDGYSFTEGPAADSKGNVFFTDQPNNQILKWDARTGEISTFLQSSGRSNGTYFDAAGNLIACADMKNQLWSIHPDGEVTVLVDGFQEKLLNGPNDLWINPVDGAIFFTDPLYKRPYWTRDPAQQQKGRYLYYLSPDRTTLTIADGNLAQPNGLVGSPNGKLLYVADLGAKKTYTYDIGEDGSLSNRRLFVEMGSDGMTIDCEGNVYLTGNGVTVFNPDGKKIEHIAVEQSWTANVVFGGVDHRTLFITAKDSVYGLEMRVQGVLAK